MENVHPSPSDVDLLPRHLASRETRSNSDYLRMMASELEMIRARKLIAPLKPRGFLPRRRDAFRHCKCFLFFSTLTPNHRNQLITTLLFLELGWMRVRWDHFVYLFFSIEAGWERVHWGGSKEK